MRTLRTVAEVRAALRPARRGEQVIGLVPTMGALHAGHLSLIKRAAEECDQVVMSLFVNPTQFDDPSDLRAYPRDESRDLALAAEAGVDIAFVPMPSEIYPPGHASVVRVNAVTETLEGAQRGAGHFEGVATVVTKLLNIVGPDVAYFGQKDAQQTVVIRQLVRDLNLPVRIEVCPTVREPDGLALSSRNARLSPDERRRATALSRGLARASALVADGERAAPVLVGLVADELRSAGVDAEYVELVDAVDLRPVERVERRSLLLVAARLGATRLIDNAVLEPEPRLAVVSSSFSPPSSRVRTERRCSA